MFKQQFNSTIQVNSAIPFNSVIQFNSQCGVRMRERMLRCCTAALRIELNRRIEWNCRIELNHRIELNRRIASNLRVQLKHRTAQTYIITILPMIYIYITCNIIVLI